MLPAASVVAWKIPRSGVKDQRAPSWPRHGFSVTSNRRRPIVRSAEARRAPVPAGPDHSSSARTEPGSAFCWVHSSSVRWRATDSSAHWMCGHSARGAECT